MSYIMVITTTDNKELAEKIAMELLEKKLAGCIQIIGPIKSSYWWKNKIETTEEFLVFIKSKEELFGRIAKTIKELHSYTVPEIIAFPIKNGLKEYLNWLDDVLEGP
ncbi:MAG: divalent-cation tolerance protein CutA [Thermosulfidibacteraceae bacterium]